MTPPPLVFVTPPLQNSKMNEELWATELVGDPDRDNLLKGFNYGFNLFDDDCVFEEVECENYKSATVTYAPLVEEQIYEELLEGNYVVSHRKPTIVSSLGAIPKDNGKIRLIHDGSRPHGASMNSYSSCEHFKYQTIDAATQLMSGDGEDYVAKVDLKSAYRSVNIHNSCYAATGLKWTFEGNVEPTYMYDARLPFGAAKSCSIFQRISNSVCRMMGRRGYTVVSYLDDYLVISHSEMECWEAYNELLRLLQDLGFAIQWSKAIPPTQKLVYLGIEIDTRSRTLSLPQNKLQDLRSLLCEWRNKSKASKIALQRLIGKLNWAARVIRGGRTFMRRLIDLSCKVKQKHHHVRLNQDARADITWWSTCLALFNGTASFIDDKPVPNDQLSCDACLQGGAAYYHGDWFYSNWQVDYPEMSGQQINTLEFFTLLLAARRWHRHWHGKHIMVYSDNTTTVAAINNGTSRSKEIMPHARELFWLSVASNFHISAKHIPGKLNYVSDKLSRLHDPASWNLAASLPSSVSCYGRDRYLLNLYGHVSYNSYLMLQARFEHNGWPFKAR